MMTNIKSVIKGIGGYVPDYILTNDELSRMVNTSDEWITTRVGIKERHLLKDPHLGTSYLGIKAVEDLLKRTGAKPEDIDLVICATSTSDNAFPSTASKIAYGCNLKNAFAFDIQAACSGFITGLTIADGYIKSGQCKKIIVLGAEKMSAIVDYQQRETCPLFGDGAGAALIEGTTEDVGIIDYIMHTDGVGYPHLHMKSGGSISPASHETVDRREHYVYQEGAHVFKHAVSDMSNVCREILKKNNLTVADVDWLVPHQANMRIIEAVARLTDIPTDHVIINIQKYGNTSAASIPLSLWDNQDKLKKGDKIILTSFGAGFIWGAIYLKWAIE